MHVSLPRRFYCVRHAMPFLTWLGFGVLAVVPWQALCGQDQSATSIVDPGANDQSGDFDSQTDEGQAKASPGSDSPQVRVPRREGSSSPFIVRGQNGPPTDMVPLQMTPLPGSPQMGGPEIGDQGFLQSDLITGRSGQAYGNLFRVGGFTGPGVGRKVAIFPLEWMPYSLIDNNLFFADFRAFRGSTDTWGFNAGGGYRHYFPKIDRILGVNAFFDYDNTSGALFRQVGFGVESLGALYDVRANAYLPTGSSAQQLSLVNVDGTQTFVNHFLLVNQQRTIANALHGFDGEIGVPVPGAIATRHDLRVFGGGYWYEGTEIASFGGWKTRVQANVIPSVSLQLEVSHDQQFKTNVVFGGSWSYGGFRQSPDQPKTQYDRMTTPVIRNYNMIVGQTDKFDKGVEVINPATNKPYFFEHVDTNASATGADGTVEHPFTTFANAQNAGPHDIIFVHANSVFTGVGVALEPDVRVLGEASGIEHAVTTLFPNSNANLGNTLLLPHPTAIPTGQTQTFRPVFLQSPGDAVRLANNSEFSGFQIGNINNPLSGPTGRGIVGDGVRDVVVRQTDVSYSGLQAVVLNNTLGTITFQGDTINDPSSNSTTFEVTGTKGSIYFSSDPLSATKNSAGATVPTPGVINNVLGTGGSALLVNGTASGSRVDFTNSTVNDTNGNGILISNDAGTVVLGTANVVNGLGIGLDLLNNSGLFQTSGVLTVDGSTGNAVVVQNLASTGQVQFNGTGANTFDVNILNRHTGGVLLNSNAGDVIFSTGLNIAGNGSLAALNYSANSGNATFNNIRITNGSAEGILIGTPTVLGGPPIVPNTGRFTVNGNTAITNVSGIGIEVVNDQSTVTFASALNTGTTTIDQRGNIGIEVLSNSGPVTFNGQTTITNANLSTRPAVDIRRNAAPLGSVTFSTLNVQGALGPASGGFGGVGVNIGGVNAVDANPAAVTFNVLNIGNLIPATNGTALFVDREGQGTGSTATGLTINSGTISAVGGTAVDIENSNINVRLTSVSSIGTLLNPVPFGINLVDNRLTSDTTPPVLNSFMFTVGTPTATSQLSGGTIRNATVAGVNINQTLGNGLFQTGGVSLNNMTIQGNNIGILARNLEQLNVSNSNISLNVGNFAADTGVGIDAANIPRVDITASLFNFNGQSLFDHAIYLHTNVPLLQPPASAINNPTYGRYLWNISNNTNTGGFFGGFSGAVGTGDLVRVAGATVGGSELQYQINTTPIQTFAVPLVFQFNNNSMLVQQGPGIGLGNTTNVNNVSGVAVDWTGQIDRASTIVNLQSSLSNNTFNLTGNGNGIAIQNASTLYTTNFVIDGNVVTATGGGNNGIFVNNFGQTNLDIGTGNGNNFTFITPLQNVNGTFTDYGMNISVVNSTINTSNIGISDNTITMSGGPQNQAILFPNMQAPAFFTFDNNVITITNAALIPGQAIDFALISKPTVVLRGTVSNTVTLNGSTAVANAPFWFNRQPLNSTTGQIIINNFPGP